MKKATEQLVFLRRRLVKIDPAPAILIRMDSFQGYIFYNFVFCCDAEYTYQRLRPLFRKMLLDESVASISYMNEPNRIQGRIKKT